MPADELSWKAREVVEQRAWLVEVTALALFLVLTGILAAIPGKQWALLALGLGLILLGKNFVRHMVHLRARRVGLVAGGGAVVAGLASLVYPHLPVLAIFLVAAGTVLLGLVLLGVTSRG